MTLPSERGFSLIPAARIVRTGLWSGQRRSFQEQQKRRSVVRRAFSRSEMISDYGVIRKIFTLLIVTLVPAGRWAISIPAARIG